MIDELRRMLWRYQAGYFLKEFMRDRLEAALRDIESRHRLVWDSDVKSFITDDMKRAQNFDLAIRAVTKAVRAYEFPQAVKGFEAAQLAVEQLEMQAQALADVKRARTAIGMLKSQIGNGFRFVQVQDAIVQRADDFFRQAKYRTVSFIAKHCSHSIEILVASDLDTERMDSLERQLSRQRARCAWMLRLWPASQGLLFVEDSLEMIDRLLANKQYILATRVLEEVEDILEAPAAFLAAKGLYVHESGELQEPTWTSSEGVLGPSWGQVAETNRLLSERLQLLAQRITKIDRVSPSEGKAKAVTA